MHGRTIADEICQGTLPKDMHGRGFARTSEALTSDSDGRLFLRPSAPSVKNSGLILPRDYIEVSARFGHLEVAVQKKDLVKKLRAAQAGDIAVNSLILEEGGDRITRVENGILYTELGKLTKEDREHWWLPAKDLRIDQHGDVQAGFLSVRTEVQNKSATGLVRVKHVQKGGFGRLQVKLGPRFSSWVNLYIAA